MKKTLLFLFIALSISVLKAQKCNAVFFSQDGQKFQVVLNGVLQNLDYGTNVKVTDLSFEGNYKVTINFEDNQQASITKSIYMMDNNTEYSFEIKKNKKGVNVMRASGMVAIAQAPAPAPTQTVMAYSTVAPAPATSTTVTETVSTTTTTGGASSNVGTGTDNVSMNVSVGGVGMNMNVNVNDGGMNTDATTTTTYTETTTTTTSSSYDSYSDNTGTTATQDVYVMPGYSGEVGCPYPMSDADFNSAKQSIASKSFADSKLTLAKQITNTNCLTSDQAKQIIELFDFEDTRLEYAKYAYGHTYDISNYYKVNDAFEFESSIEELNKYIEGK